MHVLAAMASVACAWAPAQSVSMLHQHIQPCNQLRAPVQLEHPHLLAQGDGAMFQPQSLPQPLRLPVTSLLPL
jgi:hypothetical protein